LDPVRIRGAIPALSSCNYLNCGTFGPTPTSVADEVVRLVRLTEAEGPFSPEVYGTVLGRYEDARKAVASLLGAAPKEIALTRNASDGAGQRVLLLAEWPGEALASSRGGWEDE
jgi:selenocysteine lyase/cysteine desulfurase